jgi:hypothetical protein
MLLIDVCHGSQRTKGRLLDAENLRASARVD